MKASDLLVKCLEEENVEYIFGIPGEENADLMISMNIKRLGLTENNVLVGIVTARDIVDAYQIDIVT